MNNEKPNYPPLTQGEIFALKGHPVVKRIIPHKHTVPLSEEWLYYNDNSKVMEYYIFKNEQLIGYKKE
jgi:hypothetical protein